MVDYISDLIKPNYTNKVEAPASHLIDGCRWVKYIRG